MSAPQSALVAGQLQPLAVAIDSTIRIRKRALPARLQARLVHALSLPDPEMVRQQRLGAAPTGNETRLGYVDVYPDELRLPRGGIYTLQKLAAEEGFRVVCEDRRILPSRTLGELPAVMLRDYQRRAVDKLCKVTQGTVVIPCGGGKSRLAVGAIARLRTPTLVLVHTKDLVEQWTEAVQSLLGIEAGVIGDGKDKPGPVTVALVQTLSKWPVGKLRRLLQHYGFIVLDEAHHAAADMFGLPVHLCPARYRLALTATPEREDGLTRVLDFYFGKRLLQVPHEMLFGRGFLLRPRIELVPTAFEAPHELTRKYTKLVKALSKDEARNELIVEAVAGQTRAGHSCLLLTTRVDHCDLLASRLRDQGLAAAAVTGRTRPKARRNRLKDARSGHLRVLCATALADEGLDVPILSRGFLAGPGRASGRTAQKLGRIMRIHPDKRDAVLYDFVDGAVNVLLRHAFERRRTYKQVLGVEPPRPQWGAWSLLAEPPPEAVTDEALYG